MKILRTAAAAAILCLGAGAANAQSAGNATGLVGGAPSATVPAAASIPAGKAEYSAGRAVVVGSGAHGGGPAPIVSGASPQTEPFTSGVTDGTAKIGKGAKTSGEMMHGGMTVSPAGGAQGAEGVPTALAQQGKQATTIVPK